MGKQRYSYPEWSTEEIDRRIKLYQSPKGHLDIRKIHTSHFVDSGFIWSLSMLVLIVVLVSGFFALAGNLWSSQHIIFMGLLSVYPLLGSIFMGFYAIAYRFDEIKRYYEFKRIMCERESSNAQTT